VFADDLKTYWLTHLHLSASVLQAQITPAIGRLGNSLDKVRHIRSVAYSAELVLLNKHQI